MKFVGRPTSLEKSRTKYDGAKHANLAVVPNPKPASIPSKKTNQNCYSGNGHDTVGPAVYNPNLATVKNKAPTGDF